MSIGDWFSRKALPEPGVNAILIDGLTSSTPQDIRAYANEGYTQNPVVFACAMLVANAAASVKLELHRTTKGEKEVILDHPLLSLLERPNPTQTWEEFAIELVTWHRVAGEAFVLRLPATGKPKELYLLNPASIEIEAAEKGGVPKAYTYGSGERKVRYPVNIINGASQVLHIKTFNPHDPWRGLSPLSPAARAVDTHNNGSRWNSSLLMNSARPSGVLEVTGAVDESTVSRLRSWFKEAWQGAGNVGTVPLLTGGAKFTPLSHNPKDMDFQNSMGEAAKNTGLVYGVPLPLLTMEAATFSNMDAAQERLWTETVLPLLNLVIKKLSAFLVPLYDKSEGMQLAYNADSVPALEAKRQRMFNRMKDAVGGGLLTPNEARAEMGYDALDGGDELFLPGTLQPINAPAVKSTSSLVKAMKAAGYTATEMEEALGPEFGMREAA